MPVFHSIQYQYVDVLPSIDMTSPNPIQIVVVSRDGFSPSICDCLT
ncbi:hypothetical protein [Marinomonas sp.]